MTRPASMPPAERFDHGTRSRYVSGCRCRACKDSNVAAYHERRRRELAALAELDAPPPAEPVRQRWTKPDGTIAFRIRARGCPGRGDAQGCPWGSALRKDSQGGICHRCRAELVQDRLVDASAARRRIRALSRKHIGRRAIAAAADVAESVVSEIAAGRKRQIRASTERRILSLDDGARADSSLVPAAPTLAKIAHLIEEGDFTRAELARRLGYKTPALQLRRDRILARNALRVERFYRRMMDVPASPEGAKSPP